MSPDFETELERLEKEGWRRVSNETKRPVPASLLARYPWLPAEILEVLEEVDEMISGDATCWLLTSKDYAGEGDSAFAWNEWELQSLEGAGSDESWAEEIRAFWDRHLPVGLSLDGGYGFHAIRDDGVIVWGNEPEFEETTEVPGGYLGLLRAMGAGRSGCA